MSGDFLAKGLTGYSTVVACDGPDSNHPCATAILTGEDIVEAVKASGYVHNQPINPRDDDQVLLFYMAALSSGQAEKIAKCMETYAQAAYTKNKDAYGNRVTKFTVDSNGNATEDI